MSHRAHEETSSFRVPIRDDDLVLERPSGVGPIAAEAASQVVDLWHTDGVMTASHETPFGALPGSVVINFALVDAAAHTWDVSASVGRAIEFPPDWIPGMTGVVELTCTEHTVEIGLVKPPTTPPPDATDTQRLMAAAGRAIPN